MLFAWKKKPAKKKPPVRQSLQFETLENRCVMAGGLSASLSNGVLTVLGTDGADSIVVRQASNRIAVNGVKATFAVKDVNSIVIDAKAGDDSVQLQALAQPKAPFVKPITVIGGGGNDTVRGTNGKDVFFAGSGRTVTIDAKGVTQLDGAAPTWADTNIRDEALRQLMNTNLQDGAVDRREMLEVFNQVKKDGKVASIEFEALKAVANNRTLFGANESVYVLTRDVVVGNVANKTYAGATLGNLAANDTGAKLDKLVGKWFLGADRPDTKTGGMSFQYTVAAGNLFGASGPQYSDVKQGYVGDCYYVGALGEIAYKDANVIRNMFIVNGDGTYTVRFFNNGKADYVTVDSQLPMTKSGGWVFASGLGVGLKDAANVLWVALAEKAYAQMNQSGWLRATGGLPGNGKNSYDAIAGGLMSDALKQVTGKAASNLRVGAGAGGLQQFVTAFNGNKMIGFASNSTPANKTLVGGHQYVVVGYNATTQKVMLFNPWGVNGSGGKAGLVTLSWAEIQTNFQYWTTSV